MRKEQSGAPQNYQDSAYALASGLAKCKRNKLISREEARAARRDRRSARQVRKETLLYLRGAPIEELSHLSDFDQARIDSRLVELTAQDASVLESKKDQFSNLDRTKLLFKAKAGRRSGLTKEERAEMYKDAGYTDLQIQGLTGKQRLSALLATGILSGASEGARAVATTHPDLIPYLDHLSGRSGTIASSAALGLYSLSYGLFAWQNLRFAREGFASGNTFLTEIYLGGDMLFPDNIRDLLAWGAPVAGTLFTHGALLTAAIEGTTGNTKSVIAGNLAGAGANALYLAGGEAILNRKKKRKSNPQPEP